jgi:steroid delta-isomerase-like uncharacterized protein
MAVAAPPAKVSNAELARWAFEMLNRRDLDALRQIYADDVVERFPDRVVHSAAEIVAYFEETFAAVTDFHLEVIAVAAQDDDVFVHWHMTGRHTGTLLGIAATGKALAIDGMDHFVMREGKVISNFVLVDQIQYARQLGMMPADGSRGDRAMKAAFNARTKLAARLKR